MIKARPLKSITIIGCQVTHEMLHFDDIKRICRKDRVKPHRAGVYEQTDLTDCTLEESGMDYDELGFTSCPYCHGAIRQGKNTPLYITDSHGERYIENEYTTFDLLVFPTSPEGKETDKWLVGKYVGGLYEEQDVVHMAYADMTHARREIKAALVHLGLWREHNFGIHTFLVTSE